MCMCIYIYIYIYIRICLKGINYKHNRENGICIVVCMMGDQGPRDIDTHLRINTHLKQLLPTVRFETLPPPLTLPCRSKSAACSKRWSSCILIVYLFSHERRTQSEQCSELRPMLKLVETCRVVSQSRSGGRGAEPESETENQRRNKRWSLPS